jgi:hypothetical protein
MSGTPSIGTQLTPQSSYFNKASGLLTPAMYAYTLSPNTTNQVDTSISFNYDIITGNPNTAIQFYNQTLGNYNGIDITDSYDNSIIGNRNGSDLEFSANNLFKFTSSQGISVNNNITCNDISCNDISCNELVCSTISGASALTLSASDIYTNCQTLQLDAGQSINLGCATGDINLTSSTGNIKITPTNTISTTIVPYGLYVNSPGIKTYPNPTTTPNFQVYPLYKLTAELGTNQTYTPSSGFNFIYGDSREYRKSAGTTSDIERLYFHGFAQSFSWTDANTCKQYVGITDSFTYSGKDANSRTSSSFNAENITLICPSSSTQTITSIVTARSSLRINATNANATYTITNIISPNLNISGTATNVIANISNHSFFENSSFWDVSLNVAVGSSATITNMYGLKLNPPNGGTTTGLTITNNWGIYSGWTLAKNYFAGGVSIGTTTPNSSAILQADSTTQGFLPPRMTGAQANAIVGPTEGLMVYIRDAITPPFSIKGWWGYNGATWTQIG